MKKNILILVMLFILGGVNAQISEIFNDINNGKELVFASDKKGCLTISKLNFKQSYSENCAKPIDFTIHNIYLKDNRIELSMTMHYFGETKLSGFLEFKDNLLVLTYSDSPTGQKQVDKYKLK
jgi:hypothetical protein